MTAEGKITTTRAAAAPTGTVAILLTDDRTGRKPTSDTAGAETEWFPSYNKTGMTPAIVHGYEAVPGARQTRYVLITSVGRTAPLTGAQTLRLADTQPAPAVPAAVVTAELPTLTERARLTVAVLEELAKHIRREDVHAGAVQRLADAVNHGTISYAEALIGLQKMKTPKEIRGRVERAAADIGQVISLTGADVAALSETASVTGQHPEGFALSVDRVRGGDVIRFAGSAVCRTVESACWDSPNQRHVLRFEGDPDTYAWPSDGVPWVILAERPGFGPFDEVYEVGDRVRIWVEATGRAELGVVAEVHEWPQDIPGYRLYEVRYVHGLMTRSPENMVRETTPAPQVGQKWIGQTSATVVTVRQVDPLSPVVGTDIGSILLGSPHWRLMDTAEQPSPWAATAAALGQGA